MICFVDTETTGLDPEVHEVWEVGVVREDGMELELRLPVTLEYADARGLEVGGFHARYHDRWPDDENHVREELLKYLGGHVLAGNNPAFDAAFLRDFLGSAPWHYHVVDVKALVAGKLLGLMTAGDYDPEYAHRLYPPWNTEELLRSIGLDPYKAHRALNDAKQAKAMYDWAVS